MACGASNAARSLPFIAPQESPGRRHSLQIPSVSTSFDVEKGWDLMTLDTLRNHNVSVQSLDIRAVLAASETLSSEIVREALLEKLLHIVMEVAGARYVVLVLRHPGEGEGGWYVEGSSSVKARDPRDPSDSSNPKNEVLTHVAPVPLSEAGAVVPQALVLYVTRTQEVVMLREVEQSTQFKDAYLETRRPQSILCMPIVRHGGEKLVMSCIPIVAC
jgi:GAF domain-containing protein